MRTEQLRQLVTLLEREPPAKFDRAKWASAAPVEASDRLWRDVVEAQYLADDDDKVAS